MSDYKRIGVCRVCGSADLKQVLDLGTQTVIAFPAKPDAKIPRAPLGVVMCGNCSLLQLSCSFNKDKLYSAYWYESGISPTMVAALKNVVDSGLGVRSVDENDTVLDIACNDGTLLDQYPRSAHLRRIGIDPSNVVPKGRKDMLIINDFFPSPKLSKALGGEKAKIITCCAAFYDLSDPNGFVEAVRRILDRNGIFIIQMNYLGSMIKNKTYDDILIEHEEYYSLRSLEYLLNKHGLKVVDLELNNVNGGSIRVYVERKESRMEISGGLNRVRRQRRWEKAIGLARQQTFKRFNTEIGKNRERLQKFIRRELSRGKTFNIRGASTRGLMQMQFLGLTNKEVRFAEDANPRKWGLFYADTRIRIISPKEAARRKPDYKIVLPYHFITEIAGTERKFIESGGKLITAIPRFRIVG